VGYAKLNGKWGLTLRVTTGNEQHENHATDEKLSFNEAPRGLRVEAIDELPELLQRLTKKAATTAAKIAEATGEARELAHAIKLAAGDVAAKKP
jgi:hypothetical protein